MLSYLKMYYLLALNVAVLQHSLSPPCLHLERVAPLWFNLTRDSWRECESVGEFAGNPSLLIFHTLDQFSTLTTEWCLREAVCKNAFNPLHHLRLPQLNRNCMDIL